MQPRKYRFHLPPPDADMLSWNGSGLFMLAREKQIHSQTSLQLKLPDSLNELQRQMAEISPRVPTDLPWPEEY